MDLFPHLSDGGYESVHFFSDAGAGLRAVIAVHDSTLGPALGGARALSTYATETDAIMDALRLARGMTYKAALARIDHGGGKAVLILPKVPIDRVKLFSAFGRAVDSLAGRYITAEDSGTTPDDMEQIHRCTRFVVGHRGAGGSGDPSGFTAFGVLRGIEAVARFVINREDIAGLKISVLGVGAVGYQLCKLLHSRGVSLTVADIDASRADRAKKEFGAKVVSDAEICATECDIFSPCALGAVLNDYTIPLLRCRAVAGAANNQLAEPRHGEMLARRGIAYVPDYAINAGGLINVAQEWTGYDEIKAKDRTSRIYETITAILSRAKSESMRPEQVADRMAEERIRACHERAQTGANDVRGRDHRPPA
jgi:leucine dehydrogenase